jgi:hypothetical protein
VRQHRQAAVVHPHDVGRDAGVAFDRAVLAELSDFLRRRHWLPRRTGRL